MEEAVSAIPEGAMPIIGGFMGVGQPNRLIDELIRQRKAGLMISAATRLAKIASTDATAGAYRTHPK